MLSPLLILSVGLFACTEYNTRSVANNEVVAPRIEVEPELLDFGGHAAGTKATRKVVIRNVGTEALTVKNIAITEGAFTIDDPSSVDVLPDEPLEVRVDYRPESVEDDGLLTIVSDDPERPEVNVTLAGFALVPRLAIEPVPIGFPNTPYGCEPEVPVTFRNVGSAPLEIETVLFVGDDVFTEHNLPGLPLVLDPGDTEKFKIAFAPTDIVQDFSGDIWVTSNDPTSPTKAPISGAGEGLGPVTQTWTQPADNDPEPVDLMFTVDRSCSMEDDASNLAANFAHFANSNMSDETQVMVVTQDSGCHNGEIFTTATPNFTTKFTNAVFGPGNVYGYSEAGLTLALNALRKAGSGQCNDGFLRRKARLHVVMVSDEHEQSGQPWNILLGDLRRIDSDITLHAVTGLWPCGSGADGYTEAVAATDGIQLSLCTADWSAQIETLAEELRITAGPRRNFALDWVPDVLTLEVHVDGVPSTDWAYDADDNEIVFSPDAVPGPGQVISATYEVPECSQ